AQGAFRDGLREAGRPAARRHPRHAGQPGYLDRLPLGRGRSDRRHPPDDAIAARPARSLQGVPPLRIAIFLLVGAPRATQLTGDDRPRGRLTRMDALAQPLVPSGALPDRARLTGAMAAVAAERDPTEAAGRARILEIVKTALAAAAGAIRTEFEAGGDVRDAMADGAAAVDRVLGALLDVVAGRVYPAANPTTGDRLCVVAVGGYGRGTLAPHSDVDLLFLLPYKKTPRGEQIVEYVLYMLWDAGL